MGIASTTGPYYLTSGGDPGHVLTAGSEMQIAIVGVNVRPIPACSAYNITYSTDDIDDLEARCQRRGQSMVCGQGADQGSNNKEHQALIGLGPGGW